MEETHGNATMPMRCHEIPWASLQRNISAMGSCRPRAIPTSTDGSGGFDWKTMTSCPLLQEKHFKDKTSAVCMRSMRSSVSVLHINPYMINIISYMYVCLWVCVGIWCIHTFIDNKWTREITAFQTCWYSKHCRAQANAMRQLLLFLLCQWR